MRLWHNKCECCGKKAVNIRISSEKGRGVFVAFECKRCSKDMTRNWKRYLHGG
jgi:hypothetical protein